MKLLKYFKVRICVLFLFKCMPVYVTNRTRGPMSALKPQIYIVQCSVVLGKCVVLHFVICLLIAVSATIIYTSRWRWCDM